MAGPRRLKKRIQEVGEPSEEKAVVKYLRFDCPTKSTNMMGHGVEHFIVSKIVDCLLESKWAKTKKGEEVLFTTRESVVDYCNRYAHFRPGCQEDEGIKNAICTLLDTWTSIFPGDFSTRSGLCALSKMKAYLIIHCPYSDVLIRVHELLTSLLSETSEESD